MKIFVVLLVVVILASLQIVRTEFREDKLMSNYVPVNEAVLELQFTVYEKEEWQEFFGKYKEAYITREMVYNLLTKLGTADVIPFDEVGKQKPLSRVEWNEVYQQLVDYLDIENRICVKNILIMEREEGEEVHTLKTQEGTFSTKLPLTFFEDWASYDVYMLGDACVGVIGEAKTENVISNAYVTDATEDAISFLFRGNTYEKEANLNGQTIAKGVADIKVADGEIITIAQKKDYIEGHLLSYDDSTIEIEGYGRIAHSGRLPVYRSYDVVEELSVSDIVLGNMDVKYIVGENEVCAILITAPAEISQVRVLLLNDEGDKFRENIYLMGSGDVFLACGDINTTIPAGTIINTKDYLNTMETTLVVAQNSEESLLYLCDESGKKISNGYSGNMEVRLYQGGYSIVNEVDFETYLYSVVPSEMPSNYQSEALKAQAVCARSYAYIQVVRADLAEYGAHINDTSSYQVYNHVAKTKSSIKAVDETAGKVMLYEGDVIEAYYFSTSMGYTDTAEVWNPIEGVETGYLKRTCLNRKPYDGDLSSEEGFKAYLTTEAEAYDSNIKFYRWKIEADYSEMTSEVKEILKTRRAASERHVSYYNPKGEEEDSMKNFGTLERIEVAKRSNSGSILELKVHFEKGYALVKNEYNIRKILGCGMTGITYKDGSKGKPSSLIPSAFCTVEEQEDGTYLLYGGGYGHGIGMSQNGANGLAKAGYNYIDILNYFYKDIELVDIRS